MIKKYIQKGKVFIRLALVRTKDNLSARKHPDLFRLRKNLLTHLHAQNRKWPKSYGGGYFYQGWARLKITGQRATEIRYQKYELMDILKPNMRVLDIGANACMMSCAIAENVKTVDALEYNPYLIAIGKEIAEYLGLDNINFINTDFETFSGPEPYDLITSFANHHTADGNLVPELRSYFERIHSMLNDNGYLLFESHHYDKNDPYFHNCISNIYDLFEIKRKKEFSPYEIGNRSPLSGQSYRIYYVMKKISYY